VALELQEGETALAFYNRLLKARAFGEDFTGVNCATVAALAVADRNEKVQRSLLAEVKGLRADFARVLPPVV
jgi:hypothetical protein